MRAVIGRPYGGKRTSFPISASDIRRWAVAVYYPEPPPPLFWDEAYAATTRHGGIVAPEEFNPFAWMTADGPPKSAGGPSTVMWPEAHFDLPDPGTTKMLNGGFAITYTAVRMRPGDVITSETSLADYSERTGRLGLMLFTVTENRWTNQEGELVKSSRDTLIRY